MQYEEIVAYVKALVYIALLDEEYNEGEEQYIAEICNAYGLKESDRESILQLAYDRKESLEDVCKNIEKREMKLRLLYDVIYLCHADGIYSDVERNGVCKVCKQLEVELEKVKELEELVTDVYKLDERMMRILEVGEDSV